MGARGKVIDARELFRRPLTSHDVSAMLSDYQRTERRRRMVREASVVLIVAVLLGSVLWLAAGGL